MDDRVKHFLRQCSRDLGVLDQILSGFGKTTGLPEKSPEAHRFRARRAQDFISVGRYERLAGQCRAVTGELLSRYRYQTPMALAANSIMHAPAVGMQSHVAVSQCKSIEYRRQIADGKR